jgi:hypothetical protein
VDGYNYVQELESKKQELRNAYISANEDIGQIEAMDEWKETLLDGLKGSNGILEEDQN